MNQEERNFYGRTLARLLRQRDKSQRMLGMDIGMNPTQVSAICTGYKIARASFLKIHNWKKWTDEDRRILERAYLYDQAAHIGIGPEKINITIPQEKDDFLNEILRDGGVPQKLRDGVALFIREATISEEAARMLELLVLPLVQKYDKQNVRNRLQERFKFLSRPPESEPTADQQDDTDLEFHVRSA